MKTGRVRLLCVAMFELGYSDFQKRQEVNKEELNLAHVFPLLKYVYLNFYAVLV